LAAGTYQVTVTDALSATAVNSFVLNQPAGLSINIVPSGLYCTQPGNGILTSTVSGGTLPYSYNWGNGANTSFINGLAAGTYQLTATDANGCSASNSGVILPHFTISHAVINASCMGNDGAININLSSGNYTFNWSNGRTTEDLSGLAPGIYTLQINNNAGCVVPSIRLFPVLTIRNTFGTQVQRPRISAD
jgi:hypothetical protein